LTLEPILSTVVLMNTLNITKDDLLTVTHGLLVNDSRSLSVIADESGLNYHWLGKFKQEKYEDPGVKKIQKLYSFLILSA